MKLHTNSFCEQNTIKNIEQLSDEIIAQSIIKRDVDITRVYLYEKCYPLFKSIYDNYYTDCDSCVEFINEIYLLILIPNKTTGKCQMENFRGESTLFSWLKSTCLYYCYGKYERKKRMPFVESLPHLNEKYDDITDRFIDFGGSYELNLSNMNRIDVEAILNLMPNKRYSTLIRLRYLEQKTNEETAEALGMSMDNYYNKHKLAKAQYEHIYRKEGHNV